MSDDELDEYDGSGDVHDVTEEFFLAGLGFEVDPQDFFFLRHPDHDPKGLYPRFALIGEPAHRMDPFELVSF